MHELGNEDKKILEVFLPSPSGRTAKAVRWAGG